MTQQELDELIALIQSGANPDRAQTLAQAYADWQRNLAKQAVQAKKNQFDGCKNAAEVVALSAQLLASASPEMAGHVKALASKRFNELAFGVTP